MTNATNTTDTTDATLAHAIPSASRPRERADAVSRRSQYRLRLPRDQRRLGGTFTVDENARRLQRFFYFERRIMQGLGSWTLSIPEFEIKVETGRHLFWHADAAQRLRARLAEQEVRLADVDAMRDAAIDRFLDELLSAADSAELLVGAHLVLGQALETAYRHHIDDTCPIADAPTVRVLRQILVDYQPMLEWARAAIDAFVDAGADEARLESWRSHLQQLLVSIGGVTGVEPLAKPPAPLRSQAVPYQRGTRPLRDARFATFCTTGDYLVADAAAGDAPRFAEHSYDDERLRFIRAQRDEQDAIEAFGTFIWDIRFKDFDAEYQLARITWDESRHTEIGHRALLASGYDPFELPNRLTPSTCRGPMAPEFAMAEINLFGEIAVIKTIGGLVDQARDRGDAVMSHIVDFIRADERTHVRKGQSILKQMTPLSMQALELRTRELFTECLVGLGAMQGFEPGFVLSREEIERHIGE